MYGLTKTRNVEIKTWLCPRYERFNYCPTGEAKACFLFSMHDVDQVPAILESHKFRFLI